MTKIKNCHINTDKKIIKRILFIVFLLILGLMLIFRLPSVQKEIANKLTNWIEEEYELKIQVDKIKPSILGGLQCNDFLLFDGNNDTLIYIEKFKIQTSNYSFKHNPSNNRVSTYIKLCTPPIAKQSTRLARSGHIV